MPTRDLLKTQLHEHFDVLDSPCMQKCAPFGALAMAVLVQSIHKLMPAGLMAARPAPVYVSIAVVLACLATCGKVAAADFVWQLDKDGESHVPHGLEQ